jgi:hypothetical protein
MPLVRVRIVRVRMQMTRALTLWVTVMKFLSYFKLLLDVVLCAFFSKSCYRVHNARTENALAPFTQWVLIVKNGPQMLNFNSHQKFSPARCGCYLAHSLTPA